MVAYGTDERSERPTPRYNVLHPSSLMIRCKHAVGGEASASEEGNEEEEERKKGRKEEKQRKEFRVSQSTI